MIKYFIFIGLFLPISLLSQTIEGTIQNSQQEPLVGANILWKGTTIGASSDANGEYIITTKNVNSNVLVISYVGYETQSIFISDQTELNIELQESLALSEIEVKDERSGNFVSTSTIAKTELITEIELTKSACCDLAGCFETQASVKPTTTNIVTNSKELRILGLSGVYNQILIDGMPLLQGLTYTYGVNTIPGTMVNTIYIAQGANSVLQGFESISGQINVTIKEPDNTDKLLVNLYTNSFLEKQANVNYAHKWDKWSTLISAHSTQPANKHDRDEDSFLDMPLTTRYSVFNKWKYGRQEELGWHSMIGLRYVNEERIGGQVNFDPEQDEGGTRYYGQTVSFSQPDFYTKTGFRANKNNQYVVFASASFQNQQSYFGTTRYEADQLSTYVNLQYELNWNESNSLKTGFSYRQLNLNENISFSPDSLNRSYAGKYIKEEQIPGVFAENSFNWLDDKLVLMAGIRLDHHNTFDWFVSPRAVLKYNINETTTARASVGSGWRTLNLFSENINLLASSRDIIITEALEPEEALNYGVNITHKFEGDDIESQLTLDFYRTQFQNQIFPDYDTDPTKAFIGNFKGTSISNSFQTEVSLKFFKVVESKIAYNYLDVFRMNNSEKFVLPFNSKHRVTSAFSYKPLSKKWHVDFNVHWNGEQLLTKTEENPSEFKLPTSSDPYFLVNAQFTKIWNRNQFYIGCENIFDFRQERPILSWQNPFGPYFDTSSNWGPTKGREFYAGWRYIIK